MSPGYFSTWRFRYALALPLVLGAVALPGEENDGPVVTLPPLEVTSKATKPPPPWQYAAAPGYEALSRCTRSTTEDFLQAEHRLAQLLALVVPREFQLQLAVPRIYLLADRANAATATQAMILRAAHENRPPEEGADLSGAGNIRFLPNVRLDDRDVSIIYVAIDQAVFNAAEIVPTVDHIHLLLDRRAPALPEWLIQGVARLFDQMHFLEDLVGIDPVDWPAADARLMRKNPDYPRTLFPMAEVLAQPCPPDRGETAEAAKLWRSQAALFVRWALEGDAERKAAFWKFVARTNSQPATDAACRECLGFGFADLRDRLSDYLPLALDKPFALHPEKLTRLASVESHLASAEEVSRLKGDWERLEIGWVKERQPEYVPLYVQQARRTLKSDYQPGDDSQLLAVRGLLECDLGNDMAARPLLEKAAKARIVRPRIYYELARIRQVEALAHPAGPDGLLSGVQVNTVLEPFQVGYQQLPPLVEAYRLITEAWSHSAAPLDSPQFQICDEGLRLFPGDIGLIVNVALVKMMNGREAEALVLARRGLAASDRPALKARFEKLVAHLVTVTGERDKPAGESAPKTVK